MSTWSAFFLAGVLVRGCWNLFQLAYGQRQGTLVDESPPLSEVLYWIQPNVEQQHSGETLCSPEQHNCNKDLASWGIWTPPGDLSWCSPLEKLHPQANLLMNTSLALIGFLGNLPNLLCFVRWDAGTTPTTALPLLCFDRIIIPGQWGLCKNTNTSVVFICLRLVAPSFLCFFIFGKAALFLSPHKGNLLGNLAFQSTVLNICITQTNSVSIWAEMWVLSEHRVLLVLFSFCVCVFLTPSLRYSHMDTFIQILLKNYCSKNVSPWQNDMASASGRFLCEQSLGGNTFHQSALGCDCYTVPQHLGTVVAFSCGWTSCRQEDYI